MQKLRIKDTVENIAREFDSLSPFFNKYVLSIKNAAKARLSSLKSYDPVQTEKLQESSDELVRYLNRAESDLRAHLTEIISLKEAAMSLPRAATKETKNKAKTKTEPKPTKPEPKPESKAEPKTESKAEPKAK